VNTSLTLIICDERDLKISLTKYQASRPKEWQEFFCGLTTTCRTTVEVLRKGDAIFLIMYCVAHGGSGKTPLRVSTVQSVHAACR
jgi:hypothetical protein